MQTPKNPRKETDILIIGAGLAGLSAAQKLVEHGRQVLVVDKGRGLGGRLAGRRIGTATFDHGAQFMTARDPRFAALVERWVDAGVAEEWYRSYPGQPQAHPRWRGVPTMTALAKDLARGIEVWSSTRVVEMRQSERAWHIALDNGDSLTAGTVILTAPVPQSIDLIDGGAIALSSDHRRRLEQIEYDACIAVMAVLDGPSMIPAPGAVAPQNGILDWISDNQQKGVSGVPAVTLHASAAFSAEHVDAPREVVGKRIIEAAQPWIQATVIDYQVHGWRYSKPSRVDEETCLVVCQDPPLVLAGDAFAGPRVEGAVVSGWAAAEALHNDIP